MKKLLFIILISILSVFLFSPSHAAYWYLNLSLGSGGDGSSGDPWGSFASAKRSAGYVNPGDTVYVWGSVSGGSDFNLYSTDAGTSGNQITYVWRVGYSQPTLTGATSGNQHGIRFFSGASYITFDGFDQSGASTGITFTDATGATVIGVVIQNCSIHGNTGYGGITTGTGNVQDLSIINNSIYNNGSDNSHHGIYVSDCDTLLISGNDIYGNSGNGIQLQSKNADSHYITTAILEKNKIHDNGWYNPTYAGYGVRFGSFDGTANEVTYVLMRNNLIWDNSRAGVHWERQMTGNKEFNDTIYSNDQGGIVTTNPSSALQVRNCLSFGNTSSQIDTTSITASNNVTSDPGNLLSYTDTDSDFLRLTSSSTSCVDTGYNVGSDVTEDFDGDARPQNSVYDIGFDELLSDTTPPTVVNGLGSSGISVQ